MTKNKLQINQMNNNFLAKPIFQLSGAKKSLKKKLKRSKFFKKSSNFIKGVLKIHFE